MEKVGVRFSIAMAGNDYIGLKRRKLFQRLEPLHRICAADGEWIWAEQDVAGDQNFFFRHIQIRVARSDGLRVQHLNFTAAHEDG